MSEPLAAMTAALEATSKVSANPSFMTMIDKLTGFRVSQWKAQGDVIQQQIKDGYEEAKSKGLGLQYATSFRSTANTLNVLVKATEHIDATQDREIDLEDDIFWNLVEHSKMISDTDVQNLIAKIIAGEYNRQGTYSMATIQTLKMLGKRELDVFERVCGALIDGKIIPSLTFQLGEGFIERMSALGTNFNEFQMTQSLGLFYSEQGSRQLDLSTIMQLGGFYPVRYFAKTLMYKPVDKKTGNTRLPNFYALTEVGNQILAHLNPKFNEVYYEWLKTSYKIPSMDLVEQ